MQPYTEAILLSRYWGQRVGKSYPLCALYVSIQLAASGNRFLVQMDLSLIQPGNSYAPLL